MVKLTKDSNNVELFLKEKPVFNRQQTSNIFTITTNIYVLKPEFVLINNHLFSSKNIGYIEISKQRCLDIDDNFDYLLAKKNFDEKYS
jgi:N-acylneuraminate cytidylyltransferase